MRKENIFLSTIASDAPFFAREYGFGLEITEYLDAFRDHSFSGNQNHGITESRKLPLCA